MHFALNKTRKKPKQKRFGGSKMNRSRRRRGILYMYFDSKRACVSMRATEYANRFM